MQKLKIVFKKADGVWRAKHGAYYYKISKVNTCLFELEMTTLADDVDLKHLKYSYTVDTLKKQAAAHFKTSAHPSPKESW